MAFTQSAGIDQGIRSPFSTPPCFIYDPIEVVFAGNQMHLDPVDRIPEATTSFLQPVSALVQRSEDCALHFLLGKRCSLGLCDQSLR